MKAFLAFVLGVAVVVGGHYGLPALLRGSDAPERADAVVVLAGGERSRYRLLEGLRLVDAGYATNLVVSGVEFDPGHRFFDAPTWAVLQAQFGKMPIVVDPRSEMTQQSARFVRDVARERGWRRVLVVTSAFHWRRTRAVFRYECEPAARVRVCTINDQRYELWWYNPARRGLVFNEYYGLAHFLFAGSPYGWVALGTGVLVAAGFWLARRLIP
jgi:uncharacterized SAM-binding protein YcdF (DUF218 family)